jgi:hypothetical protein
MITEAKTIATEAAPLAEKAATSGRWARFSSSLKNFGGGAANLGRRGFGAARRLAVGTAEFGAKALTIVGKVAGFVGAYNEASRVYRERKDAALATATFVIAIPAGWVDDAIFAIPGGAGMGPESESFEKGSGMAQAFVGDVQIAADRWLTGR